MNENQKSVSDWALETFGPRDAQYRALMVLEEALELCAACDIPRDVRDDYINHVLTKIARQSEPGGPEEEAADVLSCLYAFASTADFDIHGALDRKMAFNRTRPKTYYDMKSQEKGLK